MLIEAAMHQAPDPFIRQRDTASLCAVQTSPLYRRKAGV